MNESTVPLIHHNSMTGRVSKDETNLPVDTPMTTAPDEYPIQQHEDEEEIRKRGYVPPKRVTGWVNVIFILFSELVGTGILGLPYTFVKTGWAIGLGLLFIFSAAALYSGILLWKLHMMYPYGVTYGNLAEAASGQLLKYVVFIFVYIAFFGNLAINLLLCAQSLQNLFWNYKSVCLYWYTVASAAALLPLSQLRTLHMVSYAGMFSTAAILLAVVLLLGEAYGTWSSSPPAKTEVIGNSTFVSAFSAATTAVFAFGGQGLYMETMSEMKNPLLFKRSLVVTTLFILVLYIVSASSLYFRYGDTVTQNVLYMLPNGVMKRVASFAMFVHVMVSYLLANQVIGRAIHVRVAPSSVNQGNVTERLHWFLITFVVLVVSWIIANAVPFFSNLLGIVAAISTAPLTFGFPAYFYILASKKFKIRIHMIEIIALVGMILIAICLASVGTVVNVIELVDDWSKFGRPFSCKNLM